MIKHRLIPVLIIFFSLTSMAQDQSLKDMSLEELMSLEVDVASARKEKFSEAPGIISVITAEDILDMGARDLKEVLESVPGFSFGQDVLGVQSVITRGIWGQEGRVLLLVDGVELNETSYGTLQLPNHIPIEQVSRIEIIRGPGSAIYGGFAELGVIKVVTKKGSELNGFHYANTTARTSKELSRFNNTLMFGKKEGDLEFSFKGTINKGNASDKTYTDETGEEESLKEKSEVNDQFFLLNGSYKGLYAKYLYDHYETKNIVLWGDLLNDDGDIRSKVPKQYNTEAVEVGYNHSFNENLSAELSASRKEQEPYYQPDFDNEEDLQNSWRREVVRSVYKGAAHWQMSNFFFDFGGEYTVDEARSLNRFGTDGTSDDVFGHNGKRTATLSNTAFYTQGTYYSDFANITLGARYDDPNAYENTLVPRFAITKDFGGQHIKFLYAQAFRAPVIENISLNDEIKPEKTQTTEIEWGTLLGSSASVSVNVFDTQLRDIIVYSYDSTDDTEHYTNYDLVHTQGFEVELKYKDSLQKGKLNISNYFLSELKDAEPFETDESSISTFGAPRWKVYLSDRFKLYENFFVTPSLLYLAETYAKDYQDDEWQDVRFPDVLVANIFANWSNVVWDGMDIGFGIKNLTDANLRYIQPYVKPGDYQAGPYPSQSREYFIRLAYGIEY